LAHSLSAFSAISQKGEQLANGEVAGERAQPDLEASVRSMAGGSFEAEATFGFPILRRENSPMCDVSRKP
jgi:hypothetical protein